MSRYITYDTDRINSLPFASVVERYGGTVDPRTGMTKCIWHDDHHPSLHIVDTGDKKFCHCYACGKSASMVSYVMEKTGKDYPGALQLLSDDFGIPYDTHEGNNAKEGKNACSHKKNCREIMDHHICFENKKTDGPKEFSYFSWDFLEYFEQKQNSFTKCLIQLFEPRIVEVFAGLYCLGGFNELGREDDVMFPSIDENLMIHNIKIQHYCSDANSPDFLHCDKKHIFWLGNVLKAKGEFAADAIFDNSCLFGQHLLPDNQDLPVVLVESPKNAVIGACAFNDYVWVATGNKNNISRHSLECLRERDVIVIPDIDAVNYWKQQIESMRDIANFVISPLIDTALPSLGPKADIADLIISQKMG